MKFLYYDLGLIHEAIGNRKESVENYLKSLEYGKTGNATQELLLTLHAYLGIVEGYFLQSKHDKVIAWCDTISQYISVNNEELLQSRSNSFKKNIYILDRFYAYSYTAKEEFQKAREYIDKCDVTYPDWYKSDIPSYYELKAFYYWKNNNYKLAYQYINKAVDSIESKEYTLRELNFLLLKADILKGWKHNEDAYDLLRNVYMINDSINQNELKDQISTIESMYKVQHLETEIKLQNSKLKQFRTMLIGGISVSILVIIILFVIWVDYKKIRERNKFLYHSHNKAQELHKENEGLKLERMLLKKGADPDEVIIQKLDKYMKESQLYLEPNISREIVASKIYTNRQYLLDAIRVKRGQSFNEYIYTLRLQNAYNKVANDPEVSILKVFENSGFANRSVFNKEFKKEFGMTPSELRSITTESNQTT